MGSINQLRQKFNSINLENEAQVSVEKTKDVYLNKNLQQLLDGKTKSGSDIFPSHLQDPFFKSIASAQRYSDWKDRISPKSKRKKGIPNLYIDGTYHRTIAIAVASDNISITSSSHAAADIEGKFKGIYGIGGEYRGAYIKETLRPVFIKNIKSKMKL